MTNKTTKTLYGGDVVIDFYPDSHRYKLVGNKDYLISVTSATGVIDKSRFLIPWAVSLTAAHMRQYLEESTENRFTKEELWPVIEEATTQHTVKKEEAATIGNQVHDFAAQFALAKGTGSELPGIPEEADERVIAGINAFLDWYNANSVQFQAVEQLVYSRAHEYVGHFDVLAEVNGIPTVIDYKTGRGMYNEFFYQVSGYLHAHNEEHGGIEQSMILHFDKETGAVSSKILTKEDHESNLPVFLACLAIKKREKELSKSYYEQQKNRSTVDETK